MLHKKIGISKFLAVVILLLGVLLRVYHLFRIDFSHEPFRLGGLFVAFAEEIAQNGFKFPVTIPYYSSGGIPFAYPPLGFYIEAIFLVLFPGQQVAIANLLPPFVSVLALLLAYGVLRGVFPSKEKHVLAGIFAYAFLPNAFTSQIEAGGLAESFGSLALLVYFAGSFRFKNEQNHVNAVLAGVSLGLCILSSPGSAIGATILTGLLVVQILLHKKGGIQAFIQSGMIVMIGAIVSAPYWLTVMLNHGRGFFIVPILAQYQQGGKTPYLLSLLNRFLNFNLVDGTGAFLWNAVIFLGLLWLLLRGRFFLPLAFLLLFSIPRENSWLIAFPAALLFAHGLVDVIAILALPMSETPSTFKKYLLITATTLMMAILAIQPFNLVNALIADQQWRLTRIQFEGIKNAAAFIPANAQVLVLGNDALLEWAPYILQREVINTKCGLEWQPAELERITLLNEKLSAAKNWDDVSAAVAEMNGQSQIYVVSTQKRLLTALNKDSSIGFLLKLETPDVQVGILGAP